MKVFFKNNGLSIIVLLMFLISLGAQLVTGFKECNEDINEHGGKPFTFGEYITSGHCIEATFENWESEFLQMGILVLITTFLYQRGSSESNDPDKPDDKKDELQPNASSPKPVKRGGWRLLLYQNSLSIAFFVLFLLSFVLHFIGSLINHNNEQILKGLPVERATDYLTESRFWFESFENWQSEFLSVFCVVVFSIFLRQKGSSQSKPVNAPNSQTGD